MTTTLSIAELEQEPGRDLGTGPWHEIGQEQVKAELGSLVDGGPTSVGAGHRGRPPHPLAQALPVYRKM